MGVVRAGKGDELLTPLPQASSEVPLPQASPEVPLPQAGPEVPLPQASPGSWGWNFSGPSLLFEMPVQKGEPRLAHVLSRT